MNNQDFEILKSFCPLNGTVKGNCPECHFRNTCSQSLTLKKEKAIIKNTILEIEGSKEYSDAGIL